MRRQATTFQTGCGQRNPMVHHETLFMRVLFTTMPAQKRQTLLGMLGVLSLLFAGVSCAWSQGTSTYTVGQLIDVKTQHLISLEALKPKLQEADVIYIGEEHYTPSHIEAAFENHGYLISGRPKTCPRDGNVCLGRTGRFGPLCEWSNPH